MTTSRRAAIALQVFGTPAELRVTHRTPIPFHCCWASCSRTDALLAKLSTSGSVGRQQQRGVVVAQLEVFPNKKAASGGFWFFGALLLFLCWLPLISLLSMSRSILDGNFERFGLSLFCLGIFGWLVASLAAYWLQFRHIRRLQGPLLVLRGDGLVDGWRGSKSFSPWSDFSDVCWENSGGGLLLRFVKADRTIWERSIGTLGFEPYLYPARFMAHDLVEVGKFIDDHVCISPGIDRD